MPVLPRSGHQRHAKDAEAFASHKRFEVLKLLSCCEHLVVKFHVNQEYCAYGLSMSAKSTLDGGVLHFVSRISCIPYS